MAEPKKQILTREKIRRELENNEKVSVALYGGLALFLLLVFLPLGCGLIANTVDDGFGLPAVAGVSFGVFLIGAAVLLLALFLQSVVRLFKIRKGRFLVYADEIVLVTDRQRRRRRGDPPAESGKRITVTTFHFRKGGKVTILRDVPIDEMNTRDTFFLVSVGRKPRRRVDLYYDARKYEWEESR